MKYRLVLTQEDKGGKKMSFKLTVPPSKAAGFNVFLSRAIGEGKDVTFEIEQVDEKGGRELSKVKGVLKLSAD